VAHKYKTKYGICTTPVSDMVCTNGANFTELANKYRPHHTFGCGCGEGILGEGLCPRTSYGYTLSDYVSTAPGLGLMIGLATYPLIGVHRLMRTIISKQTWNTSEFDKSLLFVSLNSFQINFIAWGFASVCIFPVAHALFTAIFLGSFMVFALTLLKVVNANDGKLDLEQYVIVIGATLSFFAIVIGAIPRTFLVIDSTLKRGIFPNWNHGFGAYVFWLGEAIGLSVFFGFYPLVTLANIYTGESDWSTVGYRDLTWSSDL